MRIFYTADVIRPDGTDTDSYGEPCEEGYGCEEESGWVTATQVWRSDPDVYEERDDVAADEWEPGDGPMIDWAVARIMIALDIVEESNGRGTFYASEAREDSYTGVSARYAAHVEDAPPAVLRAVKLAVARSSRYPYPSYA